MGSVTQEYNNRFKISQDYGGGWEVGGGGALGFT